MIEDLIEITEDLLITELKNIHNYFKSLDYSLNRLKKLSNLDLRRMKGISKNNLNEVRELKDKIVKQLLIQIKKFKDLESEYLPTNIPTNKV